MSDAGWVPALEIGEHDNRKLVVNVAGNIGGKSLPGSAVLDDPVAAGVVDEPTEPVVVRVRLAVVELYGSPHLIETRALEQFLGIEGGVPLGEVENVEVERSVRGRIQGGRNPFLILEFSFNQAITGCTVGNDVGLADDARLHAQRLKDPVMQEVAV